MIDWSQVAELREGVGEDGFEEVVEIFFTEVEERLLSLQADLPNKQLEELLHFLKGSALNLGLSEFAGLCREGEKAAACGDGASIDLMAIHEAFDRGKAAFEEGLPRLAA